jgi:hypothetical protein
METGMKTTYLRLFQGLAEIPDFDDPELKQYRIDPKYLEAAVRRIASGFGIPEEDMFNIVQDFNEMCLKKRVRNINRSYCIWGIVQGCKMFLRDRRELSYDRQVGDSGQTFRLINELLNDN